MPLTKAGNATMKSMVAQYGPEKGASVFYASINKGVAGSSKWHRIKKHEMTTTTGIARYIPADSWFEFKKKRKDAMQMGMSTFSNSSNNGITCGDAFKIMFGEGGPGSGRYPVGSTSQRIRAFKAAVAVRHAAQARGASRWDRNYATHRAVFKAMSAKKEGGPGSGRYPAGSGEHAELVRKLNLIVQHAVAAKTGKATIAYRNAAMAVHARLAGRRPTAFGTVRDLYKMDFNYRPQLASFDDTWYRFKMMHEGGPGSGRYPAGSGERNTAARVVKIYRTLIKQPAQYTNDLRVRMRVKTAAAKAYNAVVRAGAWKGHTQTRFFTKYGSPSYKHFQGNFESINDTWFDYQNESGDKNSGNWGHKGVPGHQGGSKPGSGTKMDIKQIQLDVNNLPAEYARVWSNWQQDNSEKMLFICKDGRTLEVTTGEKGSVGMGLKDIDSALKENGMKWWDLKTVVHNHNKGEAPSAGDVKVFKGMMAAGFGGNSQIYSPKNGQIREVPYSGGESTWFDYRHAVSEDGSINFRIKGDDK